MNTSDPFYGDFEEFVRDYPGKKKPALRDQKPEPKPEATWDARPRRYFVNGVKQEFFTVGHVALALGRTSRTIRWWESKEVIPPATFRAASPKKSKVKAAGDRLWTRSQVEVMIRVAQEEGVLEGKAPSPVFTRKLVQAFLALQEHHNSNT
jgi:hypothetical protein